MKSLLIIVFFGICHCYSFGQVPVYSGDRTLEQVQIIFEGLPNDGFELRNTSDFKQGSEPRTLAMIIENELDDSLFRENLPYLKNVRNLYLACSVPSKIYDMENLRSLKLFESEYCFKSSGYEVFLDDSIESLKQLEGISFASPSAYYLYHHLGKLPKLKELHISLAENYPFTILTNKSVKSVGLVGSYPELEMFRQLGYKIDAPPGYFDQIFNNSDLPLTASKDLKTVKIKGKSLELSYSNGQRLVEGSLNNGQLDGVWRLWYANGSLCQERTYDLGSPKGTWHFLEENGDTLYSIEYTNGIPYILTTYQKQSNYAQFESVYSKSVTENFLNARKSHQISRTILVHSNYVEESNEERIGEKVISSIVTRRTTEGILINDKVFIEYIDSMEMYRVREYYDTGGTKSEFFEVILDNGKKASGASKKVFHGLYRKWDEAGELILQQEFEFGELKK